MLLDHLTRTQIGGLMGLSTALWGIAALQIRYFGHIFFANDLRRLTTYLASIPIGYGLIYMGEKFFGISPEKRLLTASIMAATALPLDGVAFMWYPALYEHPELKKQNPQLATKYSRMGAAWLLWGVGMCMIIAIWTS